MGSIELADFATIILAACGLLEPIAATIVHNMGAIIINRRGLFIYII